MTTQIDQEPRRSKAKRTEVQVMTLTVVEKAELERQADEENLSVSQYVASLVERVRVTRERALRRAEKAAREAHAKRGGHRIGNALDTLTEAFEEVNHE